MQWKESLGLRVNSSSWKPENLGMILIGPVDIFQAAIAFLSLPCP
jgi:hypothetical protein